jgi:hypothetical protein
MYLEGVPISLLTHEIIIPHSRVLLENVTVPELISHISWNSKVHYYIRKSPPPVPILKHKSSPWLPIPFLEDLSSKQFLSSQVSPSKYCVYLSASPYVQHAQPISLFLI